MISRTSAVSFIRVAICARTVCLGRRLPANSRVLSLIPRRIDGCSPHHYSDGESDYDQDQCRGQLRCDMQAAESNRAPMLKPKLRLRGADKFLLLQCQP